jgi:protein-L-isoaspartate(D-aspartate) O-methyltransferase
VRCKHSDGHWGWEDYAPYDGILVAAAPDEIPDSLLQQLAVGGRLVIPVGQQGRAQQLTIITRTAKGFEQEIFESVSFVPMLGGAG